MALVQRPESAGGELFAPSLIGQRNTIPLPECRRASRDMITQLEAGMPKRVVIVWMMFGGNTLRLYGENLQPLIDTIELYRTPTVYITNQERYPDEGLTGSILFSKNDVRVSTNETHRWDRASLYLEDARLLYGEISDQFTFAKCAADRELQHVSAIHLQ